MCVCHTAFCLPRSREKHALPSGEHPAVKPHPAPAVADLLVLAEDVSGLLFAFVVVVTRGGLRG